MYLDLLDTILFISEHHIMYLCNLFMQYKVEKFSIGAAEFQNSTFAQNVC